ncbi:MAG: diguanylate cyclase, partial [Gammaproteobacteria bacterium]
EGSYVMSEVELEENWKDKYFKLLLDQEDAEKENEERLSGVYKELLRSFNHFHGRDDLLDKAIVGLPKQIESESFSIDVLKDLNRQITNIDNDLDDEAELSDQNSSSKKEETDGFAIAKDSLEYLIEQLPGDVLNKLISEEKNIDLDWVVDVVSLRALIDEVKNALVTVINERNKNIKQLSSFLNGVAKRLDGIQSHLKEEKDDRKSSSEERDDLSKLVGDNLKGIRDSVNSADDLDVLQQEIESRINEIDTNVTSYVESETNRQEQAGDSSSELEEQLQKLQTQTTQLQKSLDAARTEAVVDPLTGVSNRRAYDERFQIEYSRWKRNHEPLTLAIIDIDHFKKINDTHGHPIGDKVLKVVAGRIQQQVRESDFFGRIGGEEFAFLLVNSNIDDAKEKIETLRSSVEECNFRVKKKKFQVTISIGVASFKGKDTIETIYQRADLALLKAKETGRNKCLTELDLK